MPRREVEALRKSLKPLVDAALSIPEDRLGQAEALLDKWLKGEITYKKLLEGLAGLADGRGATRRD